MTHETFKSEEDKQRWYKNRFNPARYQLSGTNHYGPSDIIPQYPGMNAHPKTDSMEYYDEESSSSVDE